MIARAQTAAKPAGKTPRLTRAQRTALLKALADPKRFELLEIIARSSCPLACSDAGATLAIAPATLSHHIKELHTAGLIRAERDGKFLRLELAPDILKALSAQLTALAELHCPSR